MHNVNARYFKHTTKGRVVRYEGPGGSDKMFEGTVVYDPTGEEAAGQHYRNWVRRYYDEVEVGTLHELCVGTGDEVMLVKSNGDRSPQTLGHVRTVERNKHGLFAGGLDAEFDVRNYRLYMLVSRAPREAAPKKLGDMTWDEAEPLYRASHAGELVEVFADWLMPAEWVGSADLDPHRVYRLTPKFKPTFAHWAALDDDIVAIARDDDGNCYGYDQRSPQHSTAGKKRWVCQTPSGTATRLGGIKIDWGDLPWHECIIERPEDE